MGPSGWDRTEQNHQIAALPPVAAVTDRVWLRLRQDLLLSDLADSLDIPDSRLAQLNDVAPDHQFSKGDWLVVPAASSRLARLIPQIDSSDLRRTPPLQQLPPLQTNAVVRLGDTVRQIARRYGMTLQELLKLNPGLETARLVVGAPITVVQSAPSRPRLLLGLKPMTSGLSWPELPDLGGDGRDIDKSISSDGWIWPTRGLFSSGFGWRWGRMHKGIDIANNVGTPVVAAKDGVVTFSGWHSGGYGYLVSLSHADGSSSLYAHNSRLLVQVGETVHQGQPISQMGSTGRSTGPHLHFEIHPPGRGAVNPLAFLPQRA
ncbi:MAG: LysM peptidoglycan-binding domain-containing protein [Synechococcaceae bacterium WB9_2_112]|nr:LysM peptidoglycan-binding domain-containing protein [Synechococcaceae bacterium WB9_2_112]